MPFVLKLNYITKEGECKVSNSHAVLLSFPSNSSYIPQIMILNNSKFLKGEQLIYYSRLRDIARLKDFTAVLGASGSFAKYQSLIGPRKVNKHYK